VAHFAAHFSFSPRICSKKMKQQKIIYDFGANKGDNINYYLQKADIVIAVEANTTLCQELASRFYSAVACGKLFVENCVLSDIDGQNVAFYLHKRNHLLSQLPKPSDDISGNFDEVYLPSRSPISIIKQYGNPFYVKIDVERYDSNILRILFNHEIWPPFISVEAHSIEAFAVLVGIGRYNAFKLVDGHLVSDKKDWITLKEGQRERYSFPYNSAGPFGEDVVGEWKTADNFFRELAFEGLGWKDIHATNCIEANEAAYVRMSVYLKRAMIHKLRRAMTHMVRIVLRR
jgi:FkbM family methyltransferase